MVNFLNNSKTTLKKSRKRLFHFQNGQKWPLKTAKMTRFSMGNFDCGGHLSTFPDENTPKSWSLKVENNARILRTQLLKNFEKVQKSTFLNPKMAKTQVSKWPKVPIFGSFFDLRVLKLHCWHQNKLKKCSPNSIRDLKKENIFKTQFLTPNIFPR